MAVYDLVQILVIAGGVAGGRQVQRQLHRAQVDQAKLCADVADTRKRGKQREKVAVDKVGTHFLVC